MSEGESAAVADRVRHLLELRRPDDALRLLGPALTASSHAHTLVCLAAQAHLVRAQQHPQGTRPADLAAADDLARRGVALDPHSDWSLRLLSLAQSGLGRTGDAVNSAYAAVQAAPFAYETHLRYADALGGLGGVAAREQARAEARRAVELAPHQPEVHLLLARTAHPAGMRSNRRDRKAARESVHRALALDPGNSVALSELARLDLSGRRRLRAASGFTEALRADPGNTVARHNLGVVLGSWLRPAHYLVFGAVWLTWRLSPLPGLGQPLRMGSAAVVVVVLGVVGLRMRRVVPGSLGVFLRQLDELSRWASVWAVTLVVAVVLLVTSALLPDDPASVVLTVAMVALLAGVVSSWRVALHQRRRR